MSSSTRAASALLLLAATALPLSAQSNTFTAGSLVNSPALTSASTQGDEMVGMALTLSIAGGGTLSSSWSDLGAGACGANFANGFTIRLGCGTNTFGGVWSIVNGSSDRISSLRLNGAPGRTLFDCGWLSSGVCQNNGDTSPVGSTGSANGWSLQTAAGGTYTGGVSGFYTNAVGLGGAAPVGDLFEQLTIQFDAVLGVAGTYNFYADTDNSRFDAPPPSVVPEPSTYALMASGLAGIGILARRRRKV